MQHSNSGNEGRSAAAAAVSASGGSGSSSTVGIGGGVGGGQPYTTAGVRQQHQQGREQYPGTSSGSAAAADSRRGSVSSGPPSGGVLSLSGLTTESGAAVGAYAGSTGLTLSAGVGSVGIAGSSGGYWERGCTSGRGWQALAALPTTQQLAGGGGAAGGGSSLSPGSGGSASGVLDGVGAAGLGGPGWPLGVGHMGYTCMVPIDSSHGLVEATLLSGSNGSSGGGYGSSGSNGGSSGLLLAGTADGRVCMLDVESGALLEEAVACWDPRPTLLQASSSSGYQRAPQQQLQFQQQPGQANVMSTGPPVGGMLGPTGWDGPTAAADPSNCVLSAVCCSSRGSCGSGAGAAGGWVGAGSGGGRVTLLDMRAGMVVANWQAHSQRVSQLQALAGAQGDHMLLSCSSDKTLKLWDLRMLPPAAAPHASLALGGSGWASSSSSSGGQAMPLVTYRSGREGIEGFVVYQDAALVYGGASIGLAPFEIAGQGAGGAAGLSGSLAGQLQHQQQQGGRVQFVRMTAVRGMGYRGSGGREGLGAAGAGTVVGLGLLPHSKLLVVGTEDGLLRICR